LFAAVRRAPLATTAAAATGHHYYCIHNTY
jgi:hypothetical protein